jgi:uncharacterized membrane protein
LEFAGRGKSILVSRGIIRPVSNRYFAAAGALFVGGILLLVLSVIRGEGAAGIALFIPFYIGTGPFSSMGVLLIFIGILVLFFAFFQGAAGAFQDEEPDIATEEPEAAAAAKGAESAGPNGTPRAKARGGAVIMIGPVPIIVGSDSSVARNLMLLAMGLMVMAIVVMVLLAILA